MVRAELLQRRTSLPWMSRLVGTEQFKPVGGPHLTFARQHFLGTPAQHISDLPYLP